VKLNIYNMLYFLHDFILTIGWKRKIYGM